LQKIHDPKLDGEKHNNAGLCYYKLGLNDKAEKQLLSAIESNPNLPESFYYLGVLYNNTNKTDTAKNLFDTCLKVDRSFSKAWEQ
jgi:lipoprotein NlpI